MGTENLMQFDFKYNSLRARKMNYNIQSWPTKMQGQRFTERLAYNAAVEGLSPGNCYPWQPLWNGRISASLYAAGTDAGHGFVYKYDPSGRLSRSYYGEGAEIELDDADYTEGFRYDEMGNITRLERYGLLDDDTYNVVDYLTLTYDGNHLVKVSADETDSDPTFEGAMQFNDESDAAVEYEYDQNGNMTKDLKIPIKREQSKLVCSAEHEEFGMKFNRNIYIIFAAPQHEKRTSSFYPVFVLQKISSIQYNSLNLPEKTIILGDGMRTYIDNTYDAAGNKLRTTVGRQMTFGPFHPSSLGGGAEPQGGGLTGGLPGGEIVNPIPSSTLITTDYCGSAIYRGDSLSMLLTEEGYVTFASDSTPVYHYYLKDHLGSIRVVFDQSGAVEQRNDYYPSGTLMYTSTNGTLQPYKFGGKELERTAGLDEYDFGARWMDPVIGGRFTTMDPMCEKFYSSSPYIHCNDDPINYKDDDGKFPSVFTAAISNIWQKIRHSDQYVSNIVDHGDRIEPERRYTYTSVDYHSEEGITVTSHSRFDWDGILADAKTSGDALQDIGDVVTIAGLATACFFPPAGASIAKAGEALSKIGLVMSTMADGINLIYGSPNDIENDITSFATDKLGNYFENKIKKLDIGDELSKNILKFYEKTGETFIDAASEKYIDEHKK